MSANVAVNVLLLPSDNTGEIVVSTHTHANRVPVPLTAVLAVPDHNVGEIVCRDYNLGAHGLGEIVPVPLALPDHVGEIVCRDYNLGDVRADGLGEIIFLVIILAVAGFAELPGGCTSCNSALLGVLLGFLGFVVALWMGWVG
jgi:hypothetical protein